MQFTDIRFHKTIFTNLKSGKSFTAKNIYLFDSSDVHRSVNSKKLTNQKFLFDRITFDKDSYDSIFDLLSIESIVLLCDTSETEYAYQLKLPKVQLSSVNKDYFKAKEFIESDGDSIILKMLEMVIIDKAGIEFYLDS